MAPQFDTKGVQITWLGHAAFRLRSAGKVFYFDPFLQPNPKCPESEKRPTVADFILLSHGHSDHISDAVELSHRSHATVVGIVELIEWLTANGLESPLAIGMNKGGSTDCGGARVTMVHADHTSSVVENGVPIYLGEPAGYIVTFSEGLRIYFAGDTAVFSDMKLIAELYRPDLAFLPIGDFYTMGPLEAAHACRLLGVRAVIPMHYGTFPALVGTPAELKKHLSDLGVPCDVIELTPGEAFGT